MTPEKPQERTSPDPTDKPAKRRKKSNGTACNRCKSRKKRCDGDFNNHQLCSTCLAAGVACQFTDINPVYVKLLQQKIDVLEQQLQNFQAQSLNEPSKQPSKGSPGTSVSSASSTSQIRVNNNLLECAAYLPLKNDDKTEVYVGYSGFSVANLVQMYLFDYQETLQDEELDFPDQTGNYNSESIVESIFSDNLLTSYHLENYLSLIQSRYPFLERSYLESLHKNRHLLLFPTKAGPNRAVDKFILVMVYAIGAHLKPDRTSREKFGSNHWNLYRHALKGDLQMVFQSNSLSNIHTLLLLVIYKLRFPDGQAIWYLIGTAIRLCVDFGLHRRNLDFFVKNPYVYTLKTRTFWSAYALERAICNSFGRPFSISNRDIDLDLPLNLDESVRDEPTIKAAFYQTYPEYNIEEYPVNVVDMAAKTSLSMALIYFKLRVIDSDIQESIYRVDRVYKTVPRDIIAHNQAKMKRWIADLPDYLTKLEYDYCLYLFNKQIRNLTMPFINDLDLDDTLFVECIKASIMTCKLNRRIHDTTSSRQTLSFVSLQTLFLSGITIAYGILSRKVQWDVEVGEGLRSCSATLTLLAERCPSCSKYKDTFESLLDQVIRSREGVQTESHKSQDLFGQEKLMEKVNQSHYNDNMKTFNTISNLQYLAEGDFDSVFNFANVDEIFYKLGGLNPYYSDLGLDV